MGKNKAMKAERLIRSLRRYMARTGERRLSILLPKMEKFFNEVKKNTVTNLSPSETTNELAPYVLSKMQSHWAKLTERALLKSGGRARKLPKVGSKVLLQIPPDKFSKSNNPRYYSMVYFVSKILPRAPRNRYVINEVENPSKQVKGSFPPSKLKLVHGLEVLPASSLVSEEFKQRDNDVTRRRLLLQDDSEDERYIKHEPVIESPFARRPITRSMTFAPSI